MELTNREMNAQSNNPNEKTKSTVLSAKKKKLIFYIIMVAPLILQVAVFYVYVNFNNIIMAFNVYTQPDSLKPVVASFAGFQNFKFILDYLFAPENVGMFGTTFMMYAILLLVAMPIGMIFSFYIYKKCLGSEFFRVVLFLPQVISAVTMTTIYKTLVWDGAQILFGVTGGLLKGYGAVGTLATIIFYSLWMGFGANILLYCGAMSGINDSVVEACHLDGCNVIQEFIHITIPSIYPTIVTFVIIDITSIFLNQMHLYTFFGKQSLPNGIQGSIGYLIVYKTANASILGGGESWTYAQLSALGVLISAFTIPVSLIVKKVMEKLGPSEN